MNAKRTAAALIPGVIALLLMLGTTISPAIAQEKTGTAGSTGGVAGAAANALAGSDNSGANGQDSNPGTAWNIRQNYFLRYPVAKEFGPSTAGGADVIQNKQSMGPGVVIQSTSGPVFIWPYPVPTSISKTPTMRDQAIQKDLFQTFGLPVSDTQFQLISRYNDNRMLEQLFDPEKLMWLATSTAGLQATSAANSQANMATNQSESAIDFTKKYLVNFTAEAGNRWQQIRDQLFIPMAILLLLPGAVLAQVRALVAQGSPVLGDINPFDGILRSIVAIFLIPGTFLVINYGIDVSNSITYTIADEYKRIFGTDMYQDAVCAEQRALASNAPNSNLNALPATNANQQDSAAAQAGQQGQTVWNQYEALTLTTRKYDPCAGVDQQTVPDEQANWQKQVARMLTNSGNVLTTGTWNVMCAFQMAFLYYLWCMGPIAAALWVWPVSKLRGALPSWIEGVITVCFWSLFWNTIVLLMACFRGVGDSGIVIMSALNTLAIYAVQYAFDFSSLVSNGGAAGIQSAMQGATQNAQSAAAGGGGGGAGGTAGAGGTTAQSAAARSGAAGGAGGTNSSAALQQALHAATGQNMSSALMGNAGSSNALSAAAHTQPGGALPHSAVPPPLGPAGIRAALSDPGAAGGALAGSAGVPHPPLSGAAAPNPMSANGIMPSSGTAGTAGMTGGGGPGALGHASPPLSASVGGAGSAGTAGMSGSAAQGMALGASAAHSSGLGLRMDANGNLQMNQDALHKMQDQMHGQDPQKALQQAMAQAQHGDTGALSNWMNNASNAHVLDSQTTSALTGMLHNNSVPTLDSHGGLHMGGSDALALAHGGEMPLTGVPAGMSAGSMPGASHPAAGSLATGGGGPGSVPPPHSTMGDAAHMAKDSAGPLGPLHPGDATSQMQGLHNLAQQEGMPNQGNFHLQDSHGNQINPNDAHAMANVPPGEHLKAVADNGHQFAAYDPGSHQWQATDAAGHAQGVSLGGNGSWQAGNVPVTADSSGHFASTAGHYAYEPGSTGAPGTGSFNVDGHHLAANSVSGDMMSSYSHGSASAHATVDALSHAGVSENLNAAMHGDAAAQAAVQHGLQGTGVHADDLYRASVNGDHLAAAHVMGQEAMAHPDQLHNMAQSLGVSDSTLANAATSHTAAGQVMAADAAHNQAYAADLHMPAGVDSAHSAQYLSEATHNPIAGAQMAGAEIAHDPGYAHQVAQQLGVHDAVVGSAGHNAVAATQMMAAEAAHNPDLARDVGPAMGGHVPAEMMAQAAHNPIAAAQVLGHDVQAHPEYASMAASGLQGSHDPGHMSPAEMMGQAAHNPIAAASVVGMESQHSGDYAGYVAQSLHMPTTELAGQMGHNSVLAAQAVGAEANYDHGYAQSVAAQMHTSPEAVMASASSPTLAAAMVGHQAEQNSSYAAHVASETHMPASVVAEAAHSPLAATHVAAAEAAAPGHETYAAQVAGPMMHVAGTPQSFDVIAHSPVAAAQALGAEVSAHPAQAAQFAHAMGTSTEQLQHAATSPIAAASVVAHDAQAHQEYGSYAAQAMHLSDAGASYSNAANHYVGAAQLVAADAAANPTYGAHVAHQLGVSPDVVQQAAHNPVAAAQMVAAEAVHNPQTMQAVASATHMSPTDIAHAVNDPGAAAMLMAHDSVSHGSTMSAYGGQAEGAGGYTYGHAAVDSGYANHIAAEMGISPQALQHAATSHSAAEQIAATAAHTYAESYGGSGQYGHAEAPSVASAAHSPTGYSETGGGGGGYADASHHAVPHVAPVSDGAGHYAAGIQDSSGHFVSAMSDGHGHYVAAVQDGQGHLVPAAADATGHYVPADANHQAQPVGAVQDPQQHGHLIAAVPDAAHPGHVAAAVPSQDGGYIAAIPDSAGHYIPADSSGHYGTNTYAPSNEVAYGGGGGGGDMPQQTQHHGETFGDSQVGHGGHSGGGYDPSANPGAYVPHASNLPDFMVAHHEPPQPVQPGYIPQPQQPDYVPPQPQQTNFADSSQAYTDASQTYGGGGGYTPDQSQPDPVIQPAPQSETGTPPQGSTISGVLADVFNQSGHSGATSSAPPVSWDPPADPSGGDPSGGQSGNPVYIADRQPPQDDIAPEVIGGAAGAAILGGALGRAIGNAGTPPPRVVAPKPQQPQEQHEHHEHVDEPGHTGHLQGQLKPQGSVNKMNKKRYKDMMADLEPMPGQKKEEEEEEEG